MLRAMTVAGTIGPHRELPRAPVIPTQAAENHVDAVVRLFDATGTVLAYGVVEAVTSGNRLIPRTAGTRMVVLCEGTATACSLGWPFPCSPSRLPLPRSHVYIGPDLLSGEAVMTIAWDTGDCAIVRQDA